MTITKWSKTASENSSPPPFGAPEGMLPSRINDVMRYIMASIREQAEFAGWFNYGHKATYIDSDEFTVPGDHRAVYNVGRQVRVSSPGRVIVSRVAKVSLSGNATKVEIQDSKLFTGISNVEVGLDTNLIQFPSGLDGLCTATSTNNGNTITLKSYTGNMPSKFERGAIYRFYADADVTGSATINGITLTTSTKVKRGDEVIIMYSQNGGNEWNRITRETSNNLKSVIVKKDCKLYTGETAPVGTTAIKFDADYYKKYKNYGLWEGGESLQLPKYKQIKVELYGAGQGGGGTGSGSGVVGSAGTTSTIKGSGYDIEAKGGDTNIVAGSKGGIIENLKGAMGGLSLPTDVWVDPPSYYHDKTGQDGNNGQKVTASMFLTDKSDLFDVKLGKGGSGNKGKNGENAYLVLSWYD